MSPSVTSSRPAIMRSAVLLPQPDGPTSTRNSRSRILRLMSLTAVTSPNFLVTWSSSTPAIDQVLLPPSLGRCKGLPASVARPAGVAPTATGRERACWQDIPTAGRAPEPRAPDGWYADRGGERD